MDDINQAKQKAARYCAYQERCRKEVEEKLFDLGLAGEKRRRALEELEKEGFFNDERYARVYARGKFTNNRWGKIKIRLGLKQKEIPDDLILLALDEIPEEAYLTQLDKLAIEKLASIKEDDSYMRKNKTARFLMQKGFEPDLVWEAIDKAL